MAARRFSEGDSVRVVRLDPEWAEADRWGDEASSPALLERLLSGEVQAEFKHVSSGSRAALAVDPTPFV